ncbi:hypothetical protein ACIP6X_34100 [Streptomyces coeruleorubidus]|uniref:hypothetical protein n=1 Tax=Streptomyces coeruleorubidus TaxID=116188 RepID=UPI0037F8CBB8
MPRNQSTAAQRARAAQRETGAKYTAALRQATASGSSPTVFSLRELLVECTTAPEWTGDHPEVDAEWAPRMFDSALLGGPVPYTSAPPAGLPEAVIRPSPPDPASPSHRNSETHDSQPPTC